MDNHAGNENNISSSAAPSAAPSAEASSRQPILWVGNPQRLNVKRSVIKFSICKTLIGWRYSPIIYENI